MPHTSPLNPQAFSDPELCRGLLDTLTAELDQPLRFMEVCGTHTVSIFRSGLRSLLPKGIEHLSGPGCPVCVTHDREIAACLELAGKDGVTVATFGDLMRVPGPAGKTLKQVKAEGGSVEIVYSPIDALSLAQNRPDRQVVFLGVGFETTAPTIAATVTMAESRKIGNFSVLSCHKLVPPALEVLLTQSGESDAPGIDAFLLPGHVSTILGVEPYRFIVDKYQKPGVVGGFDPADILQSLLLMVRMRKNKAPAIVNQYTRAVNDNGNPHAREILFSVFTPSDALWRGIGLIAGSGLAMREEYAAFDAWKKFSLSLPDVPEIKGCKCGDVLKGLIGPDKCPLFGTACTPAKPVGPCMVSTEGSCAAYFKYAL
ncbi:hydrogenase formation protein HypD [Desulfovibrio sp. OttesenSCG-928-G15]|nr:hydrogenase formation protein HypD [Desulfovibrio sp. OttesenSCG-928-G15]